MSTASIVEIEEGSMQPGVDGEGYGRDQIDSIAEALGVNSQDVTPAGSRSPLQGTEVAVEPQDGGKSPVDKVGQAIFGTEAGTMSNTEAGDSSGSLDILKKRTDQCAELGKGNS